MFCCFYFYSSLWFCFHLFNKFTFCNQKRILSFVFGCTLKYNHFYSAKKVILYLHWKHKKYYNLTLENHTAAFINLQGHFFPFWEICWYFRWIFSGTNFRFVSWNFNEWKKKSIWFSNTIYGASFNSLFIWF